MSIRSNLSSPCVSREKVDSLARAFVTNTVETELMYHFIGFTRIPTMTCESKASLPKSLALDFLRALAFQADATFLLAACLA